MEFLDRCCAHLNRMLLFVGGLVLVGMVLLTTANILLRLVWLPIRGTFELMGLGGAAVTALALGYTQQQHGHIAVDVLIVGFSKRTRRILGAVNNTVCALFFALVAWQMAEKAATLWRTGEVTETLRIIYYPITYGVAFGCAVLGLVFLADLARALRSRGEEQS